MTGAIVIAEPGNHLGKDFDPSGWCAKRRGFRIVTERREECAAGPLCLDGKTNPVECPQFLKAWHIDVLRVRDVSELTVELRNPRGRTSSLRKCLSRPEPSGKVGEYVVVVASLPNRRDQLWHVKEIVVEVRATDVLAFIRSCRGKDDVCAFGRRSPPRLVHNDRIGALPSLV